MCKLSNTFVNRKSIELTIIHRFQCNSNKHYPLLYIIDVLTTSNICKWWNEKQTNRVNKKKAKKKNCKSILSPKIFTGKQHCTSFVSLYMINSIVFPFCIHRLNFICLLVCCVDSFNNFTYYYPIIDHL